jgi:hypothetical protein
LGMAGSIFSQMGRMLDGEYAMVWLPHEPGSSPEKNAAGGSAEPLNIGSKPDLVLLPVRQPAELLQLIRVPLASFIVKETHEGDTTFLTLTTGLVIGTNEKQTTKPTYTIAVTPQMLLASPQEKLIRDAMARLASSGTPAGTLATDPDFLKARALLPASVNGFSYVDLSKVDWTAISKAFKEGAAKSAEKSGAPIDVDVPAVLARYLHFWISGSWKDTEGFHISGYLE